MSMDNIWRTRWDLASMEYEITRKDDLKVVSILQSLFALVEKGIGQMGTVEVYTNTLGDDTAFQGDLVEEGRKEALYQFVEKELQDVDYIDLYITQHGYDEQGRKVKIPNGMELCLSLMSDDYYLLEIRMNTDIFAPFSYEETSRSFSVAEKNFPLLKDFIEGVGTTFAGKWEEILIPSYMYGYFCDHGLRIEEEEQ